MEVKFSDGIKGQFSVVKDFIWLWPTDPVDLAIWDAMPSQAMETNDAAIPTPAP